jgi:hypothetical protein
MLKINRLFALSAIVISNFTFAQSNETVPIGQSYANQVWYSLENGIVKTAPLNNWDLAFAASGQGTAIRANLGNNVKVWVYPTKDASHFNTLDTTGLQNSWTELINSDETWSIGALNADATVSDAFDQGWGQYSLVTHQVLGNRIFVLKLANNSYKKLVVESLISGTYNIKVDNLDNSDLKQYQIVKSNFTGKNFAYLSLQNDEILDREPLSNSWDLIFTKYLRTLPSPYSVTGVKTNIGVKSAKLAGVPVSQANHNDAVFSDSINTIGYTWKEINMNTFQWEIAEDLSYFVKDIPGNIWKIYFTGFEGSSTGNFLFTKEKVSAVSAQLEEKLQLSIFPNPAQDFINIQFDNQSNTLIELLDLNGKSVMQQFQNQQGLNQIKLNISDLSKGLYVLRFVNEKTSVSKKIIVTK